MEGERVRFPKVLLDQRSRNRKTNMSDEKGLRRKVKDGDMTVKEAHEWLDKQGCLDWYPIRKWLNGRKEK